MPTLISDARYTGPARAIVVVLTSNFLLATGILVASICYRSTLLSSPLNDAGPSTQASELHVWTINASTLLLPIFSIPLTFVPLPLYYLNQLHPLVFFLGSLLLLAAWFTQTLFWVICYGHGAQKHAAVCPEAQYRVEVLMGGASSARVMLATMLCVGLSVQVLVAAWAVKGRMAERRKVRDKKGNVGDVS